MVAVKVSTALLAVAWATVAQAMGGDGMQMTTSSTSAMSMATESSSMEMSDMAMNSYLTPKFNNYPVLFDHLRAKNKGQAFGIFVLIIAAAFAYKLALFVSWCLEVKWFKKWNPSGARRPGTLSSTGPSYGADNASQVTAQNYTQDLEFQSQYLPKMPNLLVHVMSPSSVDLFHDFIRLLLAFCSTMMIYMLMLVAMTFVLTYVFAVILGVSLAEIFFNRWKICLIARWDLQRELERRKNCKGGEVCLCGQHKPEQNAASGSNSSPTSSLLEKPSPQQPTTSNTQCGGKTSCCCGPEEDESLSEAGCGCENKSIDDESNNERQARELTKNNEQTGNMDVNLIPAEKFA
ncbi:LAQU0S04e03378g1_1 [Lachancea quebecensis]|uniref:Copper transport protein n=1 Tax=Lachancea quebecensis TaxID=1654605 RepID=A0A0P1KPU9_9SACH|nr:LAQU0S04e03378g1_1 [Lachancea quebecensis]